jgi:hypothetical protein
MLLMKESRFMPDSRERGKPLGKQTEERFGYGIAPLRVVQGGR